MPDAPLNRRPVDDAKVTDHHALLITENLPEGLSQDEQAIYEMVAARLLEAFLPCCVKEMTEVALSAGGEIFTLKSAVIKSAGWRAVCGEPEEEAEETTLPGLQTGETLPLLASETVEKQTKPKPLHTESSLLSAMEHCGKEISDEQLRAGIREIGIALRPLVQLSSKHCLPVTIYAGTRRTLCLPKKDWRFTIR